MDRGEAAPAECRCGAARSRRGPVRDPAGPRPRTRCRGATARRPFRAGRSRRARAGWSRDRDGVCGSTRPTIPKSTSAMRSADSTKMLPGCGSAWKKPCVNTIDKYVFANRCATDRRSMPLGLERAHVVDLDAADAFLGDHVDAGVVPEHFRYVHAVRRPETRSRPTRRCEPRGCSRARSGASCRTRARARPGRTAPRAPTVAPRPRRGGRAGRDRCSPVPSRAAAGPSRRRPCRRATSRHGPVRSMPPRAARGRTGRTIRRRAAERGLDGGDDVARRNGRRRVLQSSQLGLVVRRDEVGARRQHLTELHERRPEFLERVRADASDPGASCRAERDECGEPGCSGRGDRAANPGRGGDRSTPLRGRGRCSTACSRRYVPRGPPRSSRVLVLRSTWRDDAMTEWGPLQPLIGEWEAEGWSRHRVLALTREGDRHAVSREGHHEAVRSRRERFSEPLRPRLQDGDVAWQ